MTNLTNPTQIPHPKIVLKIVKKTTANDTSANVNTKPPAATSNLPNINPPASTSTSTSTYTSASTSASATSTSTSSLIPFTSVNIAKTNSKCKTKLKHVSINTQASLIEMDSTDDSSTVSTASNASNSSSASNVSIASLENTYIVPVYGVNMRMSLDNKYIYDLDFNHVGTVLDNKSIEWLD